MAVVPIYFGSFASLKKWKNPKQKKKSKKDKDDSDDSDDEDEVTESMSLEDAYMFPIFGSMTLFGLYLVFRFVDKTYVNYLLTAYFGLLGVMATTQVGVNCVAPIVKLLGINVDKWNLTLTKKKKGTYMLFKQVAAFFRPVTLYAAKFTILHLIMMVVSVLLSGYYVATKNWIASNLFGICFALNAIQLLALDSFKTGMILLSGLFLYDIFWVFGTEVMVSVAKNFDAPVKVIFPRLFFGLPAGQAYQFAMLGLGDIVIPGVFVALCLRFDQHLAGTKNPNLGRSTRFSKPYFTACFIAYALGLGTTIYVMHTFKAAQPALLYLSPACILSVLFMGLVRGEIKEVFAYTSEEGIEAAKAKEAEEKKKQEEKKAAEKKGAADKVPALVKTDSAAIASEKASSASDSEQEKSTPKIRKRKGGKAQKNKK
ncbi:MAG: signal peptide peptidase-domain-containing protein [Linnemannia gamsii]|nr:MAG: signal peptide peptidase-domain-containing protein [Linnemannia gamsii]